MAVVTGYSAEKMDQFNNASVVSGAVNTSGALILTTRGGTQIDAGNVKGPKGDNVTAAQLAEFVPKWKAATAYAVGARVIAPAPVDQVLTCTVAHTSSTAFAQDIIARWSGDIFSGTTAERNALFGTPTTDAAIVALANRNIRFYNTTECWWESYYSTAKTGLTAEELIAGNTVGWYPDADSDLRAHCGLQSGFHRVESGKTLEPPLGDLLLNTKSRFTKSTNSGIILPFGGFYRIFASAYVSGSVTGGFSINISTNVNSTIIRGSGHKPNAGDIECNAQGLYPFLKTDIIRIFVYTADATSVWGTSGYNGTRLTVEYAGPPLAN